MFSAKSVVVSAMIICLIIPHSFADTYGIDEHIQERNLEEDQSRCETDPSCMKYANMLYQKELQRKMQRESEEAKLKQDDPVGYLLLYLKRFFLLIVIFVGVIGFYGLLLR